MEAGSVGTRAPQSDHRGSSLSRYTTETKAAFKTTEFWLTIATIAGGGGLIAAMQIEGGADDGFTASEAWLYVAIVVGLYAIGRGAAKSGSPEPYGVDETRHDVRGNTGR